MPSRKKNKGKERKAKKADQTHWWRRWSGHSPESEAHCNHGCVAIPPPDHVVSRFMNTFGELWSTNSTSTAIESTFTANPEVWKDAEYRQMAIEILLSIAPCQFLSSNATMAMVTSVLNVQHRKKG